MLLTFQSKHGQHLIYVCVAVRRNKTEHLSYSKGMVYANDFAIIS